MKKVLCMSLALLLFANSAFAYGGRDYEEFNEYKSKYRILYGIVLIVAGGVLAYDGFRTVKDDISKPRLTFTSGGEWHNGTGPDINRFIINANGTVTNTGNVKIKQATAEVRFARVGGNYFPDQGAYEIRGAVMQFDSAGGGTILSDLGINEQDNWEVVNVKYPTDMANPPVGEHPHAWQDSGLVEVVNVHIISHEKKYKKEINNVYEGIAGVLLLGGGAYLIIDYIVSLKKFDYYLKKNQMDVYVQNSSDEFKLMLSKRIL